jgi:hypothetical protein
VVTVTDEKRYMMMCAHCDKHKKERERESMFFFCLSLIVQFYKKKKTKQ